MNAFWLALTLLWIPALFVRSVRKAWGNAWHCLWRHGALWQIPAGFALAYALFDFGWQAVVRWRLGDDFWPPGPSGGELPAAQKIISGAVLPAAESLAADLNCLVATFPLSAIFGLLFVVNWHGLTGELRRAACRRLGGGGWMFFVVLVVSALCAFVKPVLFLALPEASAWLPHRDVLALAAGINAMSFVFEYLLGTCFQIYLLLLAFGWLRGAAFAPWRLAHFAVRRLGFVLKWALVIIAATLSLLHVPALLEAWLGLAVVPPWWELVMPAALAVAMLMFASVQIRLTLHNDSLRAALRANAAFLRRHALAACAFLVSAWSATLLLKSAGSAAAWCGDALCAFVVRTICLPATAALGGWILAAWAAFHRGCDPRSRTITF